jgi:crotonobetainyl-CoA:carnitine CoA-transferase CaiB-like acyl-CoA transferase
VSVDLLAGVRVLDLTTTISGPYCATLLAELGADVIKIESPEGDSARDLGPRRHAGMAAVFLHANRDKRGIVLDLRTAEGRSALGRLALTADVLVHNLRPHAAARCGAGPDTLRAINPALVHCAIRGFGADGPYADGAAYDDIIQAVSGLAAQQAWVAGQPEYMATAIADKTSGLAAAFAIVAALYRRSVEGDGCTIEVPMFETMTSFAMVEHLWGRTFVPPRGMARYPRISTPLRRPFPTTDGHLGVVVYTAEHWRRFFALIGRPELVDDDRYATLEGRGHHQAELVAFIADALATDTSAVWMQRLHEAGIAAAPYNEVEDLFTDPHLVATGVFEHVDHPTEGELLHAPTPIRYDGATPSTRRGAPTLGQHTDEVLAGAAERPGNDTEGQ